MTIFISFIFGAIAWSLCEYLLHRYVGHSKKVIGGFTKEHRSHHIDGNHFMPLRKKIRMSLRLLIPLSVLTTFIMGDHIGVGFSSGFFLFFIAYEVLHKRAHTHPPMNGYGRWVRKHHFFHHFAAPHKNFGVTSPLWDLVFGTYTPVGCIRLPAKKAMSWLLDPQTQDVFSIYAQDYQIRVRRKPRKRAIADHAMDAQ